MELVGSGWFPLRSLLEAKVGPRGILESLGLQIPYFPHLHTLFFLEIRGADSTWAATGWWKGL